MSEQINCPECGINNTTYDPKLNRLECHTCGSIFTREEPSERLRMGEETFQCPECKSFNTSCNSPFTELKCNSCGGVFGKMGHRKSNPPQPAVRQQKPISEFRGDPTRLESFYPPENVEPKKSTDPTPPSDVLFPPEVNQDFRRLDALSPEAEILNVKSHSPAPVTLNRISVREVVSHHSHSPIAIETVFSSLLESDESCYSRPGGKVGDQWTPIEYGWVGEENAGMIVIQNISGKYLQTNPSPEAKAENDRKIIEVGFKCGIGIVSNSPFTMIRPKESFRFNLLPKVQYFIRSQFGKADFNLYVIPR